MILGRFGVTPPIRPGVDRGTCVRISAHVHTRSISAKKHHPPTNFGYHWFILGTCMSQLYGDKCRINKWSRQLFVTYSHFLSSMSKTCASSLLQDQDARLPHWANPRLQGSARSPGHSLCSMSSLEYGDQTGLHSQRLPRTVEDELSDYLEGETTLRIHVRNELLHLSHALDAFHKLGNRRTVCPYG